MNRFALIMVAALSVASCADSSGKPNGGTDDMGTKADAASAVALCDPRAPDVPCCADDLEAALSGENGLDGGTGVPWAAGFATSTPGAIRPVESGDFPITGTYRVGTESVAASECDGFAADVLDCDSGSLVVWTASAPLFIALPLPVDDIDLEDGETVELDMEHGLRIRDDSSELVLHVSDRVDDWFVPVGDDPSYNYDDLETFVAAPTDHSAASCIAGPDASCGRTFRVDRLRVVGDDTVELDAGVTEFDAGPNRYRIAHLYTAVPLEGDECSDAVSPRAAYALVRVRSE